MRVRTAAVERERRRARRLAAAWREERHRRRAALPAGLEDRSDHAMIQALPAILIGLDGNDRVSLWNRAAERTFGLPAALTLGKPFLECPLPWDWPVLISRIARSLGSPEPSEPTDLRFRHTDGSEGWLDLVVTPVVGPDGVARGLLLAGTDVTARRRMEQDQARAHRMEAVARLAAGVAHEINTPAQYISDNLRFLEEAFGAFAHFVRRCPELYAEGPEAVAAALRDADLAFLVEEVPGALEQSLKGVDQVVRIVKAMKELAAPVAGLQAPHDLNQAVLQTLTLTRRDWSAVADVVPALDPEVPLVPCRGGEINQVLVALVLNAVEALETTGAGRTRTRGLITVRTAREDGKVRIEVTDSGPGMPEEIRAHVFEPFFTTKEPGRGTGLSLAFARAVIMDRHRGSIVCESEPGHGTRFVVRLPLGP